MLACGSSDGPKTICGHGTVERHGFCIVENNVLDAGDDVSVVACGQGTVLLGGQCRPAGAQCGEGTVLRDGRCIAAPRDASLIDAAKVDTTVDARADSGIDAPTTDATVDAGGVDSGGVDSGIADAASPDADSRDAEVADTGLDVADTSDAADADTTNCPSPQDETCDGRDDDCDGVIDNGEVCPDSSVDHTDPFTEGVFLEGRTHPSMCNAGAIQQFWPTLRSSYYTGFDCDAHYYVFRQSDDQLFYYAGFGIERVEASGNDTLIQTPPCGSLVDSPCSFDGQNRLYYQCHDTVRRGNGDLIAYNIEHFITALDDGRVVVAEAIQSAYSVGHAYVVLDQQGRELSRLDPRSRFAGGLVPAPRAATKSGNKAYVLFKRTWGQDNKEYVAYRLTETNQWQLMRRVSVQEFGYTRLLISDGTIFVTETDPLAAGYNQIVAYPPGAPRQVVWREVNATTVTQTFYPHLLIGPKDTP